jgi:hypothetical protein
MSEDKMPAKPTLREILTEDICDHIRSAVREELADAPSSLTEAERTAIEDEILEHTNRVLDALSSTEITSTIGLFSHAQHARADAQRFIRDRLGKRI